MNTAIPMVWRMGPKYGLQESSPPPGGLVGSDWGSGRASSTCRCAGSGTGRRRAACSRCPASTLSWSVMVVSAAIADGASARPASMLAVAQAIAVTILLFLMVPFPASRARGIRRRGPMRACTCRADARRRTRRPCRVASRRGSGMRPDRRGGRYLSIGRR